MRKFKLLIAILVVSNIAFAQSDEVLIKQTVDNYLDGGTNGDVARFKSAFLPDAIQKSIGKNGVSGMTVDALSSKIKPNEKMDRTTRILSWSYAGTAGTAVTETVYPTSKIIDLLNLLKVGNDWKIVSRVFSRIELYENYVTSSPVAGGSKNSNTKTPSAASNAAPKPKKAAASSDGW